MFGRGGDYRLGVLFQVQQPAFAPQAAAVVTHLAAHIDDSMAGNHDGDAVESVGTADGADGYAVYEADCCVRDA